MNEFSKLTLAIVMTAASVAAFAQDSHAGLGAAHAGPETLVAAVPTDGQVKKIDKEAGNHLTPRRNQEPRHGRDDHGVPR